MIRNEKPLRVIVCGTQFGRVYLKGLERLKGKYKLVGIFSRGSQQAVNCAKQYNVPLFTDISQITKEEVDIACVVIRSTVVGGQGTKIASQLLAKGIHVIQEHPVHYNDLVNCLKIARESGCHYKINTFYKDIETGRNFILAARKILAKSKPLYIDAACSVHVLFPLIDILGLAVGGFRPWSFQKASIYSEEDMFCSLTGKIKGISTSLRVLNQINTEEPDNNTHFLHRIILGTDAGSLMMTDSHGSVIWNLRMHVPHSADGTLDLYGEGRILDIPVAESVMPVKELTYRDVFQTVWAEGIEHSLHDFGVKIVENQKDSALAQHQLTACQVWGDIGELIGSARSVTEKYVMPRRLKEYDNDIVPK
ncbi:Gfo/Idh/MocA family oxidoreductase [Anaeromicropila populeti]|uniref:Thiazolinyl imide reductase n=1 Tax=Anaeromicropila populeti TaxID=37658 RepID=A0A1I6JXG4_9FIRM|nr:Gfo/Idh/MocA family oxidoreductase [Anaeromicropila populeti]SFR83641.1 thiazolinyl imide reductase [Anaeromicropila populeti]